jgi:hypothetical protein
MVYLFGSVRRGIRLKKWEIEQLYPSQTKMKMHPHLSKANQIQNASFVFSTFRFHLQFPKPVITVLQHGLRNGSLRQKVISQLRNPAI